MRIRKFSFISFMLLLALHCGVIMPSVALAQGYSEGQILNRNTQVKSVGEGSQYYLGQSNELLIRVNIWGRVSRPGQYFVPATTDLITLISLAGGPESRSRLSDVRVVRDSGEAGAEVILVNVRKFLKTGDKKLIPDLKPEDTIVVHGSAWQLVADVVQVVSQLAIVANLYYFFFVAN
jgi:hypothetical protein